MEPLARPARPVSDPKAVDTQVSGLTAVDVKVDVVGETCPIPLVEMRKAVRKAQPGQVVEIHGSHAASREEVPMAVHSLGLELLGIRDEPDGTWTIRIKK